MCKACSWLCALCWKACRTYWNYVKRIGMLQKQLTLHDVFLNIPFGALWLTFVALLVSAARTGSKDDIVFWFLPLFGCLESHLGLPFGALWLTFGSLLVPLLFKFQGSYKREADYKREPDNKRRPQLHDKPPMTLLFKFQSSYKREADY